jgi:hypothetical protein
MPTGPEGQKRPADERVSLHTVWYNFVRINKAVKMSPAMAAGVSKTLWTMNDIVALIDAAAPAPKPRGPL